MDNSNSVNTVVWLQYFYRRDGDPDEAWMSIISIITSKQVLSEIIDSNRSKNMQTERLVITRDLALKWVEDSMPSNLLITKVELIDLMNSTFQLSGDNIDQKEINSNFKQSITRNVEIGQSYPWIISFRLETTIKSVFNDNEIDKIVESNHNPEINKPQKANSLSETYQRMRKVISENPQFVSISPFNLQTQKLQMTPQSENQNNQNSAKKSHFAGDESKGQGTSVFGHSQSLASSKITMDEEEIKQVINREVQMQIRLLSKPIVQSKISHELGISFGKLPGITDEQQNLIDERFEQAQINSHSEIKKKPLDMVFMYSRPIVVKKFLGYDKIVTCQTQELGIDDEYQALKKIIHKHCISFSIIKQNATRETFRDTLKNGVKMLHIICHGKPEENSEPSKLLFEDSKEVGLLDNFGVSNVEETLKDIVKRDELKLIIVAACHSEIIAKKIKEKVGNKIIVIAINKTFAVLDKAAKYFALDFYDNILDGKNPLQSFNSAQRCLRENLKRILACCCQHKLVHIEGCRWYKKLLENKSNYQKCEKNGKKLFTDNEALELATCDACSVHDPLSKINCQHKDKHQMVDQTQYTMNFRGVPECNCDEERKQKNSHSEGCLFYEHFYENYQDLTTRRIKTPKHVCCCQNDKFPHNEDEKFMIIKGDGKDKIEENELLEKPLYQEFHPGELIDHKRKQ